MNTGINNLFTFDDFKMVNHQSHEHIKAPVAI